MIVNTEMFHDLVHRHVGNGMQLPSEFKRQQILRVEGVEENEADSRALAMSRTDCGKLVQAEAAFTPPELVVQPLVILTEGV